MTDLVYVIIAEAAKVAGLRGGADIYEVKRPEKQTRNRRTTADSKDEPES